MSYCAADGRATVCLLWPWMLESFTIGSMGSAFFILLHACTRNLHVLLFWKSWPPFFLWLLPWGSQSACSLTGTMRTMHGSRVRQGEAIMFNVHVITILPRISHDIDKHPKKNETFRTDDTNHRTDETLDGKQLMIFGFGACYVKKIGTLQNANRTSTTLGKCCPFHFVPQNPANVVFPTACNEMHPLRPKHHGICPPLAVPNLIYSFFKDIWYMICFEYFLDIDHQRLFGNVVTPSH